MHGSDWRTLRVSQSKNRFTTLTHLNVAALPPAPRSCKLGYACTNARGSVRQSIPGGQSTSSGLPPASFFAFGPWYRTCGNLAHNRFGAFSAARKNWSAAVFSSLVLGPNLTVYTEKSVGGEPTQNFSDLCFSVKVGTSISRLLPDPYILAESCGGERCCRGCGPWSLSHACGPRWNDGLLPSTHVWRLPDGR